MISVAKSISLTTASVSKIEWVSSVITIISPLHSLYSPQCFLVESWRKTPAVNLHTADSTKRPLKHNTVNVSRLTGHHSHHHFDIFTAFTWTLLYALSLEFVNRCKEVAVLCHPLPPFSWYWEHINWQIAYMLPLLTDHRFSICSPRWIPQHRLCWTIP